GNNSTNSPSVAGKKGFSLISDEKFRQLYANLLKCELLDQRLQSASICDSWSGRKASSAAVAACFRRGDSVIPSPRGILATYLHASSLICPCMPRGAREQLTAANQDALAHKHKKRGNITAVFAAAPRPALMREVFTPAAKQSLPILYIFEAGKTSLAELAQGIPVIRVDASDTVAAYRVVYESVSRARDGGGPTIIEFAPWPGDEASDPLLRLEQYLTSRKIFRPVWKRQLELKFFPAIDEAMTSLTP
ncbi:MAG: thiamine pyrophosphate-dependent enzyme, partial [Acidobacteriaceae bacterium]